MVKEFNIKKLENYTVYETEQSRIVTLWVEGTEQIREVNVTTGDVNIYYTPNRLYVTIPSKVFKFKTDGYVYLSPYTASELLDDALKTWDTMDKIVLTDPDTRQFVRQKIIEYGLYNEEAGEEEYVEEEAEEGEEEEAEEETEDEE